jgi:hypothetical protein
MNGATRAAPRYAKASRSTFDMNHQPSGTVTVWQSGRLAPHVMARPFEFTREHWLLSSLLLLSALVMAWYVVVLQRDVNRGELAHQEQRSRAVAEAQCESDQPVERRGRCIALLNGDVAALDAPAPATPDNTAYAAEYQRENLARATTVSLLASQ